LKFIQSNEAISTLEGKRHKRTMFEPKELNSLSCND